MESKVIIFNGRSEQDFYPIFNVYEHLVHNGWVHTYKQVFYVNECEVFLAINWFYSHILHLLRKFEQVCYVKECVFLVRVFEHHIFVSFHYLICPVFIYYYLRIVHLLHIVEQVNPVKVYFVFKWLIVFVICVYLCKYGINEVVNILLNLFTVQDKFIFSVIFLILNFYIIFILSHVWNVGICFECLCIFHMVFFKVNTLVVQQ